MAAVGFRDIGVSDWLAKACESVGINKPSPVQLNCIPRILAGDDVLGCAQTGSGKTAAFALPILQKLAEDPYGIFSVVLTPTRELAFQIADQFKVFGNKMNARVSVVVGGLETITQTQELSKRPHIVIATPGRLADILRSDATVSLAKVRFLVLDEADRLLLPGFADELELIMSRLPERRQTLLFSATISKSLQDLCNASPSKPFQYDAEGSGKFQVVDTLKQEYIFLPHQIKDSHLTQLLKDNPDKSAIVFVSSCRMCEIVTQMLKKLSVPCVRLHSQMTQQQRLGGLTRFRSSNPKVLIATDVASRGLDIPTVEMVINYDLPSIPADYVHRVGRTARAGRSGTSISFVTQHDVELVHKIEEAISCKLEERRVDDAPILKYLNKVSEARKEGEALLHQLGFFEMSDKKHKYRTGKDISSSSSIYSSSASGLASSSSASSSNPNRKRKDPAAKREKAPESGASENQEEVLSEGATPKAKQSSKKSKRDDSDAPQEATKPSISHKQTQKLKQKEEKS